MHSLCFLGTQHGLISQLVLRVLIVVVRVALRRRGKPLPVLWWAALVSSPQAGGDDDHQSVAVLPIAEVL